MEFSVSSNDNSRKSVTWSAVPHAPSLVSWILAIQIVFLVKGQRPRRGRWPMVPPQGNFHLFQNWLRGSCSTGRASDQAWLSLEPAGRASEPAGRGSELNEQSGLPSLIRLEIVYVQVSNLFRDNQWKHVTAVFDLFRLYEDKWCLAEMQAVRNDANTFTLRQKYLPFSLFL